MKKLISIIMALALLLAMAVTTPVAAAGTDIHVYAGDSIQAAVDAANEGDTIVVHKGEYHESVKIETDNITLEGVGRVILDGTDVDPVFQGYVLGMWITSGVTGVTITGFDIRNYGTWEELPGEEDPFIITEFGIGIWLERDSHGNIVTENKFSNCLTGIMASTSYEHIIEENKLSDGLIGISIERAGHHNKVENNNITNHLAGIGLDEGSTFNTIEKNNIANSSMVGIVISGNIDNGDSSDNKIIENRITNSGEWGIWLAALSSDNLIKENRVSRSGEYDLYDEFPGTGNIWEDNKYKTSYPDPLP